MSTLVSPSIFLVLLLAGWLNQEQQKILEYLREENSVLKAQLGQPTSSSTYYLHHKRYHLLARGEQGAQSSALPEEGFVSRPTSDVWARGKG